MDLTQAFRELAGIPTSPTYERIGRLLAITDSGWIVRRDGLDQRGIRPLAGLTANPGDRVLCRRMPDGTWIAVGTLT